MGLKKKFGILDDDYEIFRELTDEDKEFTKDLAKKVAEKAVTLVRTDSSLFPLNTKGHTNILLVNISDNDKSNLFIHTKSQLEERGFNVELRYSLSYFNWK